MAKTTIFFGILLIALGAVGYFGASVDDAAAADGTEQPEAVEGDTIETGEAEPKSKRSVTALIPAVFGGVLLVCGLLAMREGMRMHAMHAAVLVGLLGAVAGLGRGIGQLGKFMAADPTLNTRAFLFVWILGFCCAVYVVLCVASFIEARQQRKRAEASG